jgi:putative spermidine/putrescine transport system substrate-binding protein
MITRRNFVQGASLSALALSADLGIHPAAAQALRGTKLNIGTGGGSWRDSVKALVGDKLAAQGVTVDYVLGSPQARVAQLIAARGKEAPWDVEDTGSPEFLGNLVAGGFLHKINYANIPNSKGLPKFALEEYAIAATTAEDGIAYNTEKFAENGIPAPTRFSDLRHPKLKGRVAWPDLQHVEHWNAVVGLAYDAGGTETSLEKAIPTVKEIRPSYFFSSSTEVATKFSMGDVWAAPWHAGWVVRLRRQKVPLMHVNPLIGNKRGALLPVYVDIAKTAANIPGAEAFADLYLSPDVQFEHCRTTGVVPLHSGARERLMSDPENKDILLLSDKDMEGAFRIDWSKIDAAKWRDLWTREVTRG